MPAPDSSTYVALSYVWGSVKPLCTTKQNIKDFQVPGALKDRGEMPLTIQHAMDLATRLRERYFWVDTLCIIQDDEGSKHSELRKMAGIYSHAILTIVAANGDSAMCGLLGIPGISGPRQIKRYPFRFGRDATIIQY